MLKTAMQVLVLATILQSACAAECLHGRIRYEPRSFLGYACAGDCERHKSGFAWAELRGLTDAAGCRGLGSAESEGCRAWVDEGVAAAEAGERWAIENEVAEPCLCDGAGSRFRAGCLRHVESLATPEGGPAAPKRFPARRSAGKLRR